MMVIISYRECVLLSLFDISSYVTDDVVLLFDKPVAIVDIS